VIHVGITSKASCLFNLGYLSQWHSLQKKLVPIFVGEK